MQSPRFQTTPTRAQPSTAPITYGRPDDDVSTSFSVTVSESPAHGTTGETTRRTLCECTAGDVLIGTGCTALTTTVAGVTTILVGGAFHSANTVATGILTTVAGLSPCASMAVGALCAAVCGGPRTTPPRRS